MQVHRVFDPQEANAVSPGAGLIIGTAQLATPYGSVHKVHPPSESDAIDLIRKGIVLGAAGIDTARAYVGSERVLGLALRDAWAARTEVTSKLDPLVDVHSDASPALAAARAENSVLRSLLALNGVKPGLLLHRAEHISAWNGAIWECLLGLRDEGLIGRLGVSVQNPEEARAALACPEVSMIQMPFNMLDDRWHKAGIIAQLQQRTGMIVHVRSVFLQGILLRDVSAWPQIKNVDAVQVIDQLQLLANRLQRRNVKDLCVAYVRGHDWIDGCVIGMESMQQLLENIELFKAPPLSTAEIDQVHQVFSDYPDRLLNPALWPSTEAGSSS